MEVIDNIERDVAMLGETHLNLYNQPDNYDIINVLIGRGYDVKVESIGGLSIRLYVTKKVSYY